MAAIKGLDADDVHHTRQVVGQNVQCHLGGDLGQGLHQEVGGAHPSLDSPKRMFDDLAPLTHSVRIGIEPLLHGVEHLNLAQGNSSPQTDTVGSATAPSWRLRCSTTPDGSLKQTAVCVVDQTGKIKREGMVASDPKTIADFIVANAPQVIRIGFESGATSTWLWMELKKFGLPVICIYARYAKAALKMQINKSDRNDAVGIARIMPCGWYKEVRVKDLDSHAIRALPSSRALLVELKRDLENQIRGLLKNLGLVPRTGDRCHVLPLVNNNSRPY